MELGVNCANKKPSSNQQLEYHLVISCALLQRVYYDKLHNKLLILLSPFFGPVRDHASLVTAYSMHGGAGHMSQQSTA